MRNNYQTLINMVSKAKFQILQSLQKRILIRFQIEKLS